MKKQFKSVLMFLGMMLAVFTMPTMATPEPTASPVVVEDVQLDIFELDVLEKSSLSETTCGKNVCLVCDIHGRCHLEKKLDKPKFAKYQWDCSGSGTKCKICTKNGSKCIYKDKKLVKKSVAKLKCKKAKTCDVGLLAKLRRLLS